MEKHKEISVLMLFPPIGDQAIVEDMQDAMMEYTANTLPKFSSGEDVEIEGESHAEIFEKYNTELELARQYQKRFNGDVEAALRHVAENE